MKILLIRFPLREQNKFTIPWHLTFFKQLLEPSGHEVILLDGQVDPMSVEEMVSFACDNQIDLVGLGGIATCYGHLKNFCAQMKKVKPDIWLVAGGHVTADREFILKTTAVDIIVNSEGELVFSNLVGVLSSQGSWRETRGISYLDGGEVVSTPDERLLDMDELPDYDLSQLCIEKYDTRVPDYFLVNDEARELKKQGFRALHLFPARGCPYKCTFCYRHIPKYRFYSRDKLERIITYFKANGFAFFVFSDECITASKKHFDAVCELAKKHGIYWLSNSRVDYISEEILAKAMAHNCVALKYGIESFDQTMLDQMKKGTTVEENIKALNLSYQFGIAVPLQLILGADGENRATILNTREGVWSYWPSEDAANVAILNPYPGTPDYYQAVDMGLIPDKESFHLGMTNMNKSEMSVNFSELSNLELKTWQWWIHVEAALSYRIKKKTLLLNRSFRYRVKRFVRSYLQLVREPLNFILFSFYLFRGVRYWFHRIPSVTWAEKRIY